MLRFNGSPHLTSLLIILNVIVFAAWNIYPPALEFLQLNFLVSWLALEEARYWTTLGSVFSHISFLHIFLNMAALRSFGSAMEIALGPIRFIRFYLVAGIVASFTHAVVSAFILYEPSLPALGASGAVAGIILVFALLFPKEKIMLFGIIPIPAILGAVLLVGLDLWGLFEQSRGGGLPIGHGAHLGGAFTGLVYYFGFLRRRRVRF